MRAELEHLVGLANVDERVVEDLWPARLMKVRSGTLPVPALVARPEDVDAVGRVLAWATVRGVAVTPLGGGSGVCGAINDTGREVILDLGAFDEIAIDAHNLLVRAGAGVRGMALETALNDIGLTLGHYPSSLPVATIGGLVATRSSGQQSAYHGNIEDLVVGLGVVLPDGTSARRRLPVRSAVGPALHELFIGAEGALGVVVEVDLGVRRLPAATAGRGDVFPTVGAGLEAMREVMQRDLRPLVMRLYDVEDTAFQSTESRGAGAAGCLLLTAVAGDAEITAAQSRVLDGILEAAEHLGVEPWNHWLERRFDLSAERLRRSLEPPGSFLDTIEVAAPWSRLEALHTDVKAGLSAVGIALCHFSHATPQGCCAYFTFAGWAPDEAAAAASHREAWTATMEACARNGATIGHHHGTGNARSPWIESEMGEWLQVWKAVRKALDPAGIMSPRALGGRR